MQVGNITFGPRYRPGTDWIADVKAEVDQAARKHVEGARPMTGFLATLTPEQRGAALAYRGADGPIGANDNVPVAKRRGDWMQLYSGKQFWPLDPRADEVEIEDIAHSLSMQCRYAGHCIKFYSVAEHCVHIAEWLWKQGYPPFVIMAGLLHDATEAYLVDVPRPVKPSLIGYKEAEAAVWSAVAERYCLPPVLPKIVKDVDTRIIGDERANMRPCVAEWYATGDGLGVELGYWSPDEAESRFLALFKSIQRKRQQSARQDADDYYPEADREASAADRAYQFRKEQEVA